MTKNNKEFYFSPISGSELECKFAFPKIYFTKKQEDLYTKVYYDIGFLEDIGWKQSNSASPKYNLTSITPLDLYAGMEIVEGQFSFKIFHHDSFEHLKKIIVDGINGGKDKIDFPELYDSPFISLDEDFSTWEFHSNHQDINWSQMPLFDILLIAKTRNAENQLEVRRKTIGGVKLTSQGMQTSVDAVEISAVASFMAIGNITDWEKHEESDK